MHIRQCARCLYTEDHPLGLMLDENWLCSGCRIHEEKDSIDWESKEQELALLLAEYRSRQSNNYDCIVPVTGARDSYYIVDLLKNKFNMNPLLVTYNSHFNTERGIRNLNVLRTLADTDLLTLTVSPEKVKTITRATLRKFGSVYWHVLAGQTVFPVQIAVRLKIPLIVWGCHQGVDQVGMFSHHDKVEMSRLYRKQHDLMGYEAEDLISDDDQVFEKDVFQYIYPHNQDIANVGVRGIYLNNYVRWDTKAFHEKMIEKYGYESFQLARTFDTYSDVDSFVYTGVHDFIKSLKWGYTKVTDHATREIRFGRLTREEAEALVERYSSVKDPNEHQFLEWMNTTENSLQFILNYHRNENYWKRDENWEWHRLNPIEKPSFELIEKAKLKRAEDCVFTVSRNRRPDHVDDDYVLFSKGWY